MEKLGSIYNGILAFLGAVFGFLFGDMKGCLVALLCFIMLDFITGVFTGLVEKNLSSEVAWRGIIRKLIEILIVSAAHIFDKYVCGSGDIIFTAVCFLFISTEGISLLENAARLGVPIPKKLVEALSQLKIKAGGITTVDDIKRMESELIKSSEEQNKNGESKDKE